MNKNIIAPHRPVVFNLFGCNLTAADYNIRNSIHDFRRPTAASQWFPVGVSKALTHPYLQLLEKGSHESRLTAIVLDQRPSTFL